MLISVIITTYNSPNFLKKCIDSFFFQTDKYFELIIADDGSSKETLELVNQYKNSEVKVLHVWQKDEGFRAAKIRNEAVKISSGKYLIFIDGDCIVRNDFIKNHRKIAEQGFFARGNRVMLSENFSNLILKNNIDINSLNIFKIIKLKLNKSINRILPLLRFSKYPLKKIHKKTGKEQRHVI